MRSLRTRLALISTFVSGVAIIGVSVLAWYFMVQAVRDSIDLRLEGISGRLIRDMYPRADWKRFQERIKITHNDDFADELLILHLRDDINNEVIFSSLSDFEDFRSHFPEGFPHRMPVPKERPEWGAKKGRKGLRKDHPPGMHGKMGPPPPDEEWLNDELEHLLGPKEVEPDWIAISNDPFASSLGNHEFQTVTALGKEWRITIAHERGYFVMAGLDLTQSISGLKRLERGLLIGIPLAIALIGFGGWFVAERALRPIRSIAETTSHITTRELSARIENAAHSDPEIEHLSEVLNDMMDRLEKGFSHATRFSADVSHELKTPITVMQAEIETGLRNCDPGTPEENRLLVLRGETDRLKSITRSLMLLAQADVGELIRKSEPIDLSEELASIAEDAEIIAESFEVSIEPEIEEGIEFVGDATLLRQALLNLINNAIKYNKRGGFVRLQLKKDDHGIFIVVENSGSGISAEDAERIFDRFYRADRARSRGVDGFGLGLSLAQAVITGHGGKIRLSDFDGEVTRFEISLPAPVSEEEG